MGRSSYIKANNINITGTPQPLSYNNNLDSITYKDYDITAQLSEIPISRRSVSTRERNKVHQRHLDTNIPYINGNISTIDYKAIRVVPFFLGNKAEIPIVGGKRFFEEMILPNQKKIGADTKNIPDIDCLYYKSIGGIQHLFLRLSSNTMRGVELVKRNYYNGSTISVRNNNICILANNNIKNDHTDFEAKNLCIEANNKLYNNATNMKAQDTIRMSAQEQINKTIINKSVREERGSDHYLHEERIESIDDCIFVARNVIQEGDKVDNIGIIVVADNYEDRGTHTTNMPAKATLVNEAWKRDEGLFSSAETSVKRIDDVLIPSRFKVGSLRSISSKPGSSITNGYTLINANSDITIMKDIKKDVVVEERHILETHQEKSGFSIGGFGAKLPDVGALLSRIEKSCESGNMKSIATSTLTTVAAGYKIAKNCKELGTAIGNANPTAILKFIAKFINGPSIQFGSRSIDMRQSVTLSHGNTFISPVHNYYCPEEASFAGTYIGKEINIKTKTLITFDLPQTVEQELEVHQTGISMDLLTFALMLVAPETSTVMDAALAASSISVSYQGNKMRQVRHKPTVIKAEKLKVEADNGYLTQTQIKAGIVHAVFKKDLVLRTLANEQFQCQEGGGMSFGLGNFAGNLVSFGALADALVETVKDTRIVSRDSGRFEKKIDDFACMVGEKEFYLRVGNILRNESAFIGHITHDAAHEHIEAKEIQNIKVEEFSRSWDNSHDFTIRDIINKVQSILSNEFVQSFLEDPENFFENSLELLKEKCNNITNNIENLIDNPELIEDAAISFIKKKYNELVDENIRAFIENPDQLPEIAINYMEKKYNEILNDDIRAIIENPDQFPEITFNVIEREYNKINEDVRVLIANPEKIPDALSELVENKYYEIINEDVQYFIDHPEKIPDAISELVEKKIDKVVDEYIQNFLDNTQEIPEALSKLIEEKCDEINNEFQSFIDDPEKLVEAAADSFKRSLKERINSNIDEIVESMEKASIQWKSLERKYHEIIDERIKLLIKNPEKIEEALELLREKNGEKIDENISIYKNNPRKIPHETWRLLKEKYEEKIDKQIQTIINTPEKVTKATVESLKEKCNDILDIQALINYPKKVPKETWELVKDIYNEKINNEIRTYISHPEKVPERVWSLLREKYVETIDRDIQNFINNSRKVTETKLNLLKECNENIHNNIKMITNYPDKVMERVKVLLKEKYNEKINKDIQNLVRNPKKGIRNKIGIKF
ncbi:hypothetical protein PIROE2DRAFT_59015 [Piromyces sp. E2]|nr:hypothetical protein PIROE2DRAFT_59015 [Piromyces sp. E2]|eukprot:OUM67022.1 hypothetical protein PIROE2DRAFT_59015 [Piromyces sp. E2]